MMLSYSRVLVAVRSRPLSTRERRTVSNQDETSGRMWKPSTTVTSTSSGCNSILSTSVIHSVENISGIYSMNVSTKTCPRCKRSLPETEYWRNNSVCKDCNKEAWRKRATPEKRREWNDRARRFDDLNIQRYLLRGARKRAKEKGLECTIRPEDIKLRDVCPILGIPLVKNRGQWQSNSYSLDRRDSSRGYVPGNVEVISWKANSLKGELTIEEVERLLKYMKGEI
jgi:hypothetical protein